MIMPCMNAASAGDFGGSVALVDGGSVLLGSPGAPGWTTAGLGGACCSRSEKGMEMGKEQKITPSVAEVRAQPNICIGFGENLDTERELFQRFFVEKGD